MEVKNYSETKIEHWVRLILEKEDIKNVTAKLTANADKGEGYIGDILFVQASGITRENQTAHVDLVLKCSKQSQAFRKISPIKEHFQNETHVYNTIFPYFIKFQKEKCIQQTFTSFPKCYGSIFGEDYEVLGFENLKAKGYKCWPKQEPLTRKHVILVLEEYAKYHATSIALQELQPSKFNELANAFDNGIYNKITKAYNFPEMFRNNIELSLTLLRDELQEAEILKWENFKQQVDSNWEYLMNHVEGKKVLIHGDCWNNNFMFKHKDNNEENEPTHVAIIDWQLSRLTSPIFDLSYFIFMCASEHDVEDTKNLLKEYYNKLSNFLKALGTEPNITYPVEDFFNDWEKNAKFGILLTFLVMKGCCSDEDEVIDLDKVAEAGENFASSLNHEIKNKDLLKKRMKPVVTYALKNNLI